MNIGVFFGSRSPEHDISIITAELVIAGLQKLGHRVTPIYLDRAGDWRIGNELASLEFFQRPDKDARLKKLGAFSIDAVASTGTMVLRKRGLFSKLVPIDLAFPTFHGAYGEDGTIQGLFELLKVPYVGCDVASSAITMDKILTKLLYQRYGIPTKRFVYFGEQEWESSKPEILEEVKRLIWPIFVKPARLGSSIGIAKAKTEKDLEFAIEVALHYGERALVEESVEGVADITCAVVGDREPKASLLQESAFARDFFSYEDKYLNDGGAQLGNAEKSIHIPARLDGKTTEAIRDMAVRIFRLFGCAGIARVDFLYDGKSGEFYANEINTLPGTLYHHLWKESGIELGELLNLLIDSAKRVYREKQKFEHVFESDVLKRINSVKLSGKLKGVAKDKS